jgi:hypothetical protein
MTHDPGGLSWLCLIKSASPSRPSISKMEGEVDFLGIHTPGRRFAPLLGWRVPPVLD